MSTEILKLTQKALENNQLKELFLGASGYRLSNLKHIPASVATDIGAILEEGLYILYEKGNESIPQKLKSCVFDLIEGTPVEVWTAYSIIWSQNWDKQHGTAAFCIISSEVSEKLRKAIQKNKLALTSCKDFVGRNLDNGLWEDIARLEKNLQNKYGAGLI